MKKNIISFWVFWGCILSFLNAQIPEGYYNSAIGKQGQELLESLNQIVTTSHFDSLTYEYMFPWWIWSQTDPHEDAEAAENGYVRDFYRNCYGWHWNDYHGNVGTEECIGFQQEHIFCRSWQKRTDMASAANPQCSDLHNLFPADSRINNRRSNNPYGLVNANEITQTFMNGSTFGKGGFVIGAGEDSSFYGKCYEPIDSIRGDIARAILYMGTRYLHNTDFNEDSPYARCDEYGLHLRPWAIAMLRQWHDSDPPTEAERVRNNSVSQIQGNRNPYIDHPELVRQIWAPGSITDTFALEYVPVTIPHAISLDVENLHNLIITFDCPMNISSLCNTSNYSILCQANSRMIPIDSIHALSNSKAILHLPDSTLEMGVAYYCNVQNVLSTTNWRCNLATFSFTYGYRPGQNVLCGWTFDTDTVNVAVAWPDWTIPANFNNTRGRIYFNGEYTSTNDSALCIFKSGSLIGDPRPVQRPTYSIGVKKNKYDPAKSFVIRCSTKWYERIQITFARYFTKDACRHYTYQWSLNGQDYTTAYIDPFNIDTNANTFDLQVIDFSTIPDVENREDVFFKIVLDSSNSGNGNARFDNLCVRGEKCKQAYAVIDSISAGEAYTQHGFHLSGAQTQIGSSELYRDTTLENTIPVENDCDSLILLTLHIKRGTGINDYPLSQQNITIYPNPAHTILNIRGEQIRQIFLYNMVGQQLMHHSVDNDTHSTISVNHLPSGIYFVKIFTTDNHSITKKVVIKH